MQAYSEQAMQEMKNLPDQVKIVQACIAAIVNASRVDPTEASFMETKLSQMLKALERDDGLEADRCWRDLMPRASRWLDQQLPTGVIATGLGIRIE